MVNWVPNQACCWKRRRRSPTWRRIRRPRGIIETALADGRTALTLPEAKAVLAAFHVPVSQTLLARSPTEAVMIANRLGYPLAMKAVAAPGARRPPATR